ncbi:hypothetical protein F4813DRAFT_398148 [Daldinia decipiens]|uniref:uncharacterized protein n=1 Tax=Daldinia decipiens TaxID=326647 RepID=UPI0020C23BD9|nr:uncharacterized protein F4813DRAFT_398148 [Daldinia decipiens]KAI1655550.1 hypothetical protein F4813DRAFT_398148 [Daldinia decipiens]
MAEFDYNLFQQIYCLSMATGVVSNKEDTEANLQAALKKTLDDTLPRLTGAWSISWGPRVFKEKPDESKGGPDNVWFAVIDHTQKVCAVAIAGTASNSISDLWQDFNVGAVVDFEAWVGSWSSQGIPKPKEDHSKQKDPSRSYCAKGICDGTWHVLSNPSTAVNSGLRVDEYLQQLDSDYTVIFTGHSLGGALAPTSALGLARSKIGCRNTVKVLPSAGVSPGNDVFANKYSEVFTKDHLSSEDYKVYNTDFYNIYDIVPQAWSINPDHDRNLNNILNKILQCSDDFKPKAEVWVSVARFLAAKSHMQYTPLPGQSFVGLPPPENPIDNWDQVKKHFSQHHVLAYWDELGITEFMHIFEKKFSKRIEAPPVH